MATDKQPMAVLPTAVAVTSETDPSLVYQVQLPYCPCKDYRYRRANLARLLAEGDIDALFCKHLRKGIEEVAGWHSEPQPEVHAGITRTEARNLLANRRVMTVRHVMALFREVDKSADHTAGFEASLTGPTMDGRLEVDPLRGLCTLTLFPGR